MNDPEEDDDLVVQIYRRSSASQRPQEKKGKFVEVTKILSVKNLTSAKTRPGEVQYDVGKDAGTEGG